MNVILRSAAIAALFGSAAVPAQGATPAQPADPATPATPATPTRSSELPEFRTLDIDGDGTISQDEARAHATLNAQFSDLDVDGNGSLNNSEFAKANGSSRSMDGTESESTEGSEY